MAALESDSGTLLQGYKCEFTGPVSDDYRCKECLLVARRLSIVSCCGESYCKACIGTVQQHNKPCPNCGELDFTTLEQIKYQRKITSLQVYCTVKERGCDWSGTLQDLDGHLHPHKGDCQYTDIDCPLKCDKKLMKKNIDDHVAKECVQREYTCPYCSYRATYKMVSEKHWPECSYYPLPCPHLCGVTCERDTMEYHLNICPLQEVECPFSYAGCEAKFPRQEKEKHMKNSQKHLTMMAAASVKMSQLFHNKLEEQERKYEEKLQKQEMKFKETLHAQEKKLQKQEKEFRETLHQQQEKKFEDKLQEQEVHFEKKLQKQEEGFKEILQEQEEQFEEKLQEQKERFEEKLQEQEEGFKEILQEQEEQFEEKLQEQEEQFEEKLQEQKEQFEEKLQKQEEGFKEGLMKGAALLYKIKGVVFSSDEFIMENFSQEKSKDIYDDWKSPAMYTHVGGYKFCIGIDANGAFDSRGNSVNVELWSMKGEFDGHLNWPVTCEITIELINHYEGGENYTVTKKITWDKPKKDYERQDAFSVDEMKFRFIRHFELTLNNFKQTHFLANDCLHFKITKIIRC